MITEFTPVSALIGGGLIGLAAVLLMALNGRIAGMTRIFAGVLTPFAPDAPWRIAFLVGAVGAPLIAMRFGAVFPFAAQASSVVLIVGGVVVGIGVSYASGCTSGHGVCGMARLSRRSIAATAVFMLATFATVTLIRHGLGG